MSEEELAAVERFTQTDPSSTPGMRYRAKLIGKLLAEYRKLEAEKAAGEMVIVPVDLKAEQGEEIE